MEHMEQKWKARKYYHPNKTKKKSERKGLDRRENGLIRTKMKINTNDNLENIGT